MAFNFTGKKILVTGAGSGIGRCLATTLSKTGCHVFAVSRTESTLASLKEECPSITTVVLDLSNWDETRRVLEQLDVMDGVVNNAGLNFTAPESALTMSKDSIDEYMSINLTAAINVIQICATKMIDRGIKGSIVNVSSLSSSLALSGTLAYSVSKAGLDLMSKQFALELGPHGIRVNTVSPGMVMTKFYKDLIEAGANVGELVLKRTPSGHITEPNEVVGPILYLLSEYSSAVNGSTHVIDGGLHSNMMFV